MKRQEDDVVIARPTAEVFAYVDDIEREPEWQPKLLEVEQTPPGPTAVGTRKRYVSEFMGRRIENTYEVKELDPGRRIACQTTRDSSIDATSEVRCEAVGGGTRVTMSIDGRPTGALRYIPKRVLEKAYREELAATLQRLKAQLESG